MGGVVAPSVGRRISDQEAARSTRAFDSRSGHGTTLNKLCTLLRPCHHLVPVSGRRRSAAGKETVGLALHWSCVKDMSRS